MNLADKTVIVTGGSRGIGQQLALRLGGEKANVVVNYKSNEDAARETADEVIARGGKAIAVQADVANPDAVQSLVQAAVDRFGIIDVVVANAAASAFKPLSAIHPHHVEKTMGLTVVGFLELVRCATPHMKPGGRILAISGWDSFRVLPGHGLLGAAKAALETMIKYLAYELASQGITTVGLCPGPIDTDSFRIYAGDAWDDYEKNWLGYTPAGRFPTPAEFAEIMAFLCAPESAPINGQTIVADGGLSLSTMPIGFQ